MSEYTKDPVAVLDYKFDWKTKSNGRGYSDWLGTTETITSFVVAVPAGITLDSSTATDTNTTVTAWLSGGTAGTDYTVACKIITSEGRTDERSITIKVAER